MAVELTPDDFYRLPKHVQEQLEKEGLAPESKKVDPEEVERIRSERIEEARRVRIAAERRYKADRVPTQPIPSRRAEPPQESAHGPAQDRGYASLILFYVLIAITGIVALHAPAEVAGLFGFAALVVLALRLGVRTDTRKKLP